MELQQIIFTIALVTAAHAPLLNHLDQTVNVVDTLFKKLYDKLSEQTIKELQEKLLPSELNSLLLSLFNETVKGKTPGRLLEEFNNNRFVRPSDIDPIRLKMLEVEWLDIASHHDFKVIDLSPVAPLGASSVFGKVHQNNIVSATRGTEVVSDATNVLALQIANDQKSSGDKGEFHYVSTHRHTRGQAFDNPLWSAHFGVLCAASGGWDKGNYETELYFLNHHLKFVFELLSTYFLKEHLQLKFYFKSNNKAFKDRMFSTQGYVWHDHKFEIIQDYEHEYYELVQFKIFTQENGEEVNLADGGFVDWTRQLLSNNKLRLFISGLGTDLILRIRGN